MRKGGIRKEQILVRLLEEVSEKIADRLNVLKEQQEEIRAAYRSKWEEYLEQILQAQKQGQKGPIGYICISFLRSEILCGSHGYRLDAYEESWYLDETPVSSHWSCDVLWRYYEADIAYLEKVLQKPDQPRLKEPEIQWMKMFWAEIYHELTQIYDQMTIEEIQQLESYQELKKAKELYIYSGEYLEPRLLLYQAQAEEQEQIAEKQADQKTEQSAAANRGNQEYYLLKQDPGYKKTPQITNWFQQIDKRKLNRKEAKAIAEQTLFKIKTEEDTEIVDYLADPFILMSQEMKEVVSLYEPYMKWKEVILLDSERAESEIYYLPILEKAECVSPASQTSVGKTRLQKIKLEAKKLPESSIFQLSGEYDESYTIIRQDLIESVLRRKLTGIALEKVQLV